MCRDNDTDVRKFIGVLHAIRAVPPKAVQIKIKYAIRVIIDHHHHQNHHNLHCSNFHFPHDEYVESESYYNVDCDDSDDDDDQ